jgi:hypothetical protein
MVAAVVGIEGNLRTPNWHKAFPINYTETIPSKNI